MTRNILGVLCAALLAASPAAGVADLQGQVERYRLAHEADIVGSLAELVRLPSIEADPAGLAAAATTISGWLTSRGFAVSSLSAGAGTPPVVFGALDTPGARHTVVFYAHYDGQPVTRAQWSSDPFLPVMRSGLLGSGEHEIDWQHAPRPFDPEWRLYGRSTSDDKAAIVAFIGAFDALKATGHRPSVNLRVVWEGEEEAGSPHLAAILKAHRELFPPGLWLIGDGPVHQSRKPLIDFGARGTISVEATIYGPIRALHDGHYGNWVPNPAAMAANLVAKLRDDEGRILIPGFDADVRPVTEAERAAIAALPPVEDGLKTEFAVGRSEGSESLPASLMRPALNVRGLRAGQVGAAAANAIPTEAVVSIDFRLVPDQTPEGVRSRLEQFLASLGWTVVAAEPDRATRLAHARIVRLNWETGYPALRSDMSTPAARAVIAAASTAARQPVAVLPMMGGSVPIYLFKDIVGANVVGLPIANHDNNQHAANENIRLKNLWDGIDVYAAMMVHLNW